jgi:hypothetical protein
MVLVRNFLTTGVHLYCEPAAEGEDYSDATPPPPPTLGPVPQPEVHIFSLSSWPPFGFFITVFPCCSIPDQDPGRQKLPKKQGCESALLADLDPSFHLMRIRV